MELDQLKQEISYKTARSSGAGGQHVNKVETKVELRFDVVNSAMLNDEEKARILSRLSSRITKDGMLILTNQSSRSQAGNKEAVTQSFFELLEMALQPPRKRKKVKPLVANREERLKKKRRHSEKKSSRQKVTI